jgi:hypothetical protein
VPSANKGAFLCWPGRGWLLLVVVWLPLCPPCLSIITHTPERPRNPPYCAEGKAGVRGRLHGHLGPQLGCAPRTLPVSSWEEEGAGRGMQAAREVGSPPAFPRTWKEVAKSRTLIFGILQDQAVPWQGPPTSAPQPGWGALPGPASPFPRNGRRGCHFSKLIFLAAAWLPGVTGAGSACLQDNHSGAPPAPSALGEGAGLALKPRPSGT